MRFVIWEIVADAFGDLGEMRVFMSNDLMRSKFITKGKSYNSLLLNLRKKIKKGFEFNFYDGVIAKYDKLYN
jgi:hypothetical protein